MGLGGTGGMGWDGAGGAGRDFEKVFVRVDVSHECDEVDRARALGVVALEEEGSFLRRELDAEARERLWRGEGVGGSVHSEPA